MRDIKKIEVEGETLYLKKSGFFNSWSVVKPVKNEDGSFNWFNFLTGGSWWNLGITVIVIVVVLGVLYEYTSNMQHMIDCFKNDYTLELCKKAFMPNYTEIILP